MTATLKEMIIRTVDRYMDTEPTYSKAEREVLVQEDMVMELLNDEQARAFVRYEEAREKLEEERVRIWCKMMMYYYGNRGDASQ